MKKNNKQKGYVLAIVIILTFVMTVTIASAFTLIMRYMMFAKKDLGNFVDNNNAAVVVIGEEVRYNAWA